MIYLKYNLSKSTNKNHMHIFIFLLQINENFQFGVIQTYYQAGDFHTRSSSFPVGLPLFYLQAFGTRW